MEYTTLKLLHILSATLLFGTGLGSAFYKWRADQSRDPAAIAVTNKNVVLADWLFTTPTGFLQPLTGALLANHQGYSFTTPWLLFSIILFLVAGICWLVVVYLQLKMRDISLQALRNGAQLSAVYYRHAGVWFWLGITAFCCIMTVYVLMIRKPVLFD